MFDVAICVNLVSGRNSLTKLIENVEISKNQIRIHDYDSCAKLIEAMKEIIFSLVFLDSNMKGLDEEDMETEMKQILKGVTLVVYSDKDPSPSNFEMQPFRYIKNSMQEELKLKYVTDAIKDMILNRKSPILTARRGNKLLLLKPKDIVYIEKYKKTTRAYITKAAQEAYNVDDDSEIRISNKLLNIYEILKPFGFGYPHDSYIVNYAYLKFCTGTIIKMDQYSDTIFKLSRNKSQEFLRHLNFYIHNENGKIEKTKK